MKISSRHVFYRTTGAISLFVLLLAGCATDTYQRRAEVMKDHVETFYTHLKANRVAAAVHENEQIEAMADQMADTVRKQGRLQGTSQVEREFALMKTARGTAAQNWIALGQYFAIKQQPEKARASYQRVVDTYTDPTERTYQEQAARALKDLEMLSEPSPDSTR
ncbi:hypothetical protein [Candidatus Nitrospira nitrificans]|uniref:Tetratricopeptide repeat protein n=1 Tax=Candidatus Nitrospira nitrificans TaxID=1742973 RepID=A0A0S4LKN8_9BACT|nr:hypothetical protein [Candidatus Nitrospira nitrificans]CUS37261.1 conserved exported hypothetical protein [Candidatus Nitrospira nitrificans]